MAPPEADPEAGNWGIIPRKRPRRNANRGPQILSRLNSSPIDSGRKVRGLLLVAVQGKPFLSSVSAGALSQRSGLKITNHSHPHPSQ